MLQSCQHWCPGTHRCHTHQLHLCTAAEHGSDSFPAKMTGKIIISFNYQTRVFSTMCSSRKNPSPPHGRSLEIPRGRGVLKVKMKLNWNFLGKPSLWIFCGTAQCSPHISYGNRKESLFTIIIILIYHTLVSLHQMILLGAD